MDDQWQVVSQTPTAAPPTPPPTQGGDQWEVASQTPTSQPSTPPQKPQDPTVGQVGNPIEQGKGLIKGVGDLTAGLMDVVNKPIAATKGGQPYVIPELHSIAEGIRARTKPSNSDQEFGKLGETIAELMALPEAEGEELLAKVPKLSEWLGKSQTYAKIMESDAKLARVVRAGLDAGRGAVTGAARGGVEQALQTAVKSGVDPQATVDSLKWGAIGGGLLGGLVGGGGTAYREGREAVGKYASEVAPGNLKVGQTDFPLVASEKPNATPRAKAATKVTEQPQILEARQELVPQEIGNMNENAIRTSLGRSNAEARPPITGPTGDSALPPPTLRDSLEAQLRGHQAMMADDSFASLDPAEQQSIQSKMEQRKQQLAALPDPAADRAALEQQYSGYSKAIKSDSFDRLDPDVQRSITGKAEALKQQLDAMPETPKLSPQQQQLRDYQALRASKSFDSRSPEYQDRINQNIADLTDQLEKGNAWQPHDIEAAVASGRATPQQAGDVLHAEHKPVYEAIDKANNGKLSELHQTDQDLRTALKNVASVDEIPKIRAAIKENDAKLDQLFEEPNAVIPKAVRQQARQGWRDGAAMHDVGDLLEKFAYNGVTPTESAASDNTLKRLFKGGDVLNRRLQTLAEDRPELQYLLGPNGVTNLKQMGKLLETPESAYEAQGLLGKLSKAFKGQKGRSKSLASVAAYGPTHALAIAGAHGAAATLEGAANYITEKIATDPEINNMFSYAVKNKVDKAISVPLLLRKLTGAYLTSDNKEPQRNEPVLKQPNSAKEGQSR